MKIFKFLFAFALFASLASCSKEEDVTAEAAIMGEWIVTDISYEGTSTSGVGGTTQSFDFTGTGFDMDLKISFSDDPKDYTAEGDYSIKLVTDFQGSPITTDWTNVGFIGSGDWVKTGNTLTVTASTGEIQSANIVELTDSKMIISWDFEDTMMQQGSVITQNVSGTYTFEK